MTTRAAVATGLPVHQTGHWDSASPYAGTPVSWMHSLRTAGHEVVSIGKLHFRSAEDDNGFTDEILPMHVVGGVGWTVSLLRENLPDYSASAAELAADVGVGPSSYTDYDLAITAAALSAVVLGRAFGLSDQLIASLAPKSVTAPIAMGIAEQIGGITAIAAVLAVVTGITGAVVVTPLFTRLGFMDWRARGFAVGVTCHGIGTAHAFQVHTIAGIFATIGMALNGLFSSVLLPFLFLWQL